MGDKQSATADDGGAVACSGGECETVEGSEALATGVDGPAAEDQTTDAGGEALPSETEIIVKLVSFLGQQSHGRHMPISEIYEQLPPQQKRLVGDTESICRWVRRFPELFEISGPSGGEQIMLTLGKQSQPAAREETPPAGAAATGVAASGLALAAPLAGAGAAAPETASSNRDAATTETGGNTSTALDVVAKGEGDDDGLSPSTVQLRGLPFRATIGEIRAWLGDHASQLVNAEPAIRLLLNRDGRPSGFARVQFTTPQAAQACREALHKQPMGDRYVEVLACNDRSGKARHRRAAEVGAPEGDSAPADGGLSEYAERTRVLQECQDHMRMPGRNQLLLSMLGIALSPPARNYLRRANLGLKHFLARFPNEFRVEGPKGCERVVWCGHGGSGVTTGIDAGGTVCVGQGLQHDAPGTWATSMTGLREPSTPKLPSAAKQISHAGVAGLATPSDWGSPHPQQQQQVAPAEAAAAAAVSGDYGAFPGGSDGNWAAFAGGWGMPPWSGQPWMPWQGDVAGATEGSTSSKVAGSEQSGGRTNASSTGKRAARGDASAARSHAHLHPQSHPFAAAAAAAAPAPESAGSSKEVEAPRSTAQPALRLRGLPFSVTVQDVLAFFAQHDVADRIADGLHAAHLLPKANGRPSGQAVVTMRSLYDAQVAKDALNNQWIGGRYIEVFSYGDGDDSQGADECGINVTGAALSADPVFGGDVAGVAAAAAAEWQHPAFLASAAPSWGTGMPPWAGAAPPPIPGATLGGHDGLVRADSEWDQMFNWLWVRETQVPAPMPSVAAAATKPASAPSGAANTAPTDAAPRATLQV